MSTQNNKTEEISQEQLSKLIARIEEAIEHELALSVEDMKLLLMAINTLSTLQQNLESSDVTLHKLKKLLGIINSSEKRSNSSKKKPKSKNKKPKSNKPKSKPKVVVHKHTDLTKGDTCPDCGCGKLYKVEPAQLLRITGYGPFEKTQHISEQLRCNACQSIKTAELPAEVLADGHSNQKYGYSARSIMAINKFFSGLPYYHQDSLSVTFGEPISSSTIYDQCTQVANAVEPVVDELLKQSASAPRFAIDDTHNKILTQEPELRDKPNGKGQAMRSGVYTSGLIAFLSNKSEVVLFDTSLGHAGEHLDKVLQARDDNLPAPLVMSDALSSNSTTKFAINKSYCNAHCRRQFIDLENLYPKTISWVLEKYNSIWKLDKQSKTENMDAAARLEHHNKKSLPVMTELYNWAINQQQSDDYEEHSALGKAINYLVRHYDKLTAFCHIEGAMIDNNRMEETLKMIIRLRKTAHFFRTKNGARLSNILNSLIATAHRAEINIFDYLTVLQQNRVKVKANPELWLPWNYNQQIKSTEELIPDKAA